MKQLLLFRRMNCPRCRSVMRYLDELMWQYPIYKTIQIRIIDEAIESDLAAQHDYSDVPSFFYNGQMLHEGKADRQMTKRILDTVLRA
ncbi:MAG: glutaredoxin [Christensenellales bacterium]